MSSRRDFLKTGVGRAVRRAGLARKVAASRRRVIGRGPRVRRSLSAYIHIAADGAVTFSITKAEMGQGTVTSLSMLLAEELDCDWKTVRTEFAPVNPALYGQQGVFGSSSIRTTYGPLRQAGAAGAGDAGAGRGRQLERRQERCCAPRTGSFCIRRITRG